LLAGTRKKRKAENFDGGKAKTLAAELEKNLL